MNKLLIQILAIIIVVFVICQCKKDEASVTDPIVYPDDYDTYIADDYSSIANINDTEFWGSYNLHDPAILKYNNEYFIFSTDVMYGGSARAGIMRRKSTDLVNWDYQGWVFDKMPANSYKYITDNGYSASTIWAPYAIMIGDSIHLYYAISSFGINVSVIGLATSISPYGPWNDQGIVLTSSSVSPVNVIDPAVIIDHKTGKHWMTYGSYWSGIYIVELNPETGKPSRPTLYGKRIAFRSKLGEAMEGPEIIYNPELDKYFLFVSYDWLEDTYNVRVGRSDNPDGPYYDYFGNDMAQTGDDYPIITAQYRFKGHAGWQGFGHCGIIRDSTKYYYVSQARLSSNKYLMDLHIHKIIWTNDGWPVISPERYVNVPQPEILIDSLYGNWEHIVLMNTATANTSSILSLEESGLIAGYENSSWSFTGSDLDISLSNGTTLINAKVFYEWDWENRNLTICYSGLTQNGRSAWGKKVY
jgi:arabinan endo-1,5-alpha-L-arabinosidase